MISKSVVNAIANANRDEIDALIQLIRARQDRLGQESALTFKVGDNVKFDAKTRGIIEGNVIKVNRKTVKVQQTNGLKLIWSVSPSLLSKV